LARWFTAVPGALALTLLVALPSTVAAHVIGQSYLYLQVTETDLTGRFEIALEDLNPALGLSGTPREITAGNVREHLAFLRDYVSRHIVISADGIPLDITFLETDQPVGAGYVRLPIDISGYETVPEQITFEYSILFDEDPTHQGFVLIESNWATGTFANEAGISLVFLPVGRSDTLDLTTKGRWTGFVAVIRLGMDSFWEGLDHVLFLIALLIPAVMKREDGRWQPVERFGSAGRSVLKLLASFAVGYGIALLLAAPGVVALPARLWEIGIAVSVAVAALNILVPVLHGRLWLVVLGFGLFHGFGFAAAMAKAGVTEEFLWLSLLAFAIGLEISQLVLAAILVPALFLFRRLWLYPRLFMPASALFILAVSLAWLAERSLDIDLPIRELPAVIYETVAS
jgi:hypothetical protein